MYQSNTEGERIDLTVALDDDNVPGLIKNLQEVTTRLEIVEEELSGFSDKQEEVERVRRILSCVEQKNKSLERSLEDIKVGLSCEVPMADNQLLCGTHVQELCREMATP